MAVPFAALVRALDAAVALGDAARRFRKRGDDLDRPLGPGTAPETFTERVEARLTNVVVAALKEAFERDHARLEIEREHLDQERRRAEAARRLELRRLAVDHEATRLRWLGAAALVGWLATVLVLGLRIPDATVAARTVLGLGWLLLLASLGAAFQAQGRLARLPLDDDAPVDPGAGGRAAPWLVVTGLALAALSLLV